jgi:hypothetical protein
MSLAAEAAGNATASIETVLKGRAGERNFTVAGLQSTIARRIGGKLVPKMKKMRQEIPCFFRGHVNDLQDHKFGKRVTKMPFRHGGQILQWFKPKEQGGIEPIKKTITWHVKGTNLASQKHVHLK